MQTTHSKQTLFDFCKDWVSRKFIPFTIDDLKADYKGKVYSCLAWGGVITRLESQGFIKFNNEFVKSRNKKARGRLVKQWISSTYSEKQSLKRLSEETAKARELEKQQTNLFKDGEK